MAADPTPEGTNAAQPLPDAGEARQDLWRERARDFARIAVDEAVTAGEPVIAGTQIPVYQIVSRVAAGGTPEAIAAGFDGQITPDDVEEALLYASTLVQHPLADLTPDTLPPRRVRKRRPGPRGSARQRRRALRRERAPRRARGRAGGGRSS